MWRDGHSSTRPAAHWRWSRSRCNPPTDDPSSNGPCGAGGVGADVRAEPSKLGEYDATRFTKLAHPSELHLANIYACRHGAYLWMAASYTSAASPDAPGMETLRQSIVFTEPDPPANKWAKSLGRKYGMASPPRWHRLEGTVDKVIAEPIMGKADGNGASVRMVHGLAQIDAEHTVLVICTISAERADQAAAERIIASVTGDSAR